MIYVFPEGVSEDASELLFSDEGSEVVLEAEIEECSFEISSEVFSEYSFEYSSENSSENSSALSGAILSVMKAHLQVLKLQMLLNSILSTFLLKQSKKLSAILKKVSFIFHRLI